MLHLIISIEVFLFVFAALLHTGRIIKGYEHRKARIAESVIAAVLFSGLLAGLIYPPWAQNVGRFVQWFALVGTFVGIFTIIVGVGPRTKPDILIHSAMIIALVFGLFVLP